MAIQDDARSTTAEQSRTPGRPAEHRPLGSAVGSWITTADHNTIGYLCLIPSCLFFCLAGVFAVLIRAELFEPGVQIVASTEQYNQLFTMHGTIMLLLFATP